MHKRLALTCLGTIIGAATAIYVGPDHTVLQTLAAAGIVSCLMVLLASIASEINNGPK